MNTFFSSENKRNYVDFKKQISPKIQLLFESLREFSLSLGSDVIEDIRMHRIVFCKTITFRWFADLEPQQDGILLKIQKNRKEPNQIIQLTPDENIDEIKSILEDAYSSIR